MSKFLKMAMAAEEKMGEMAMDHKVLKAAIEAEVTANRLKKRFREIAKSLSYKLLNK
jgi:hypothetical protein